MNSLKGIELGLLRDELMNDGVYFSEYFLQEVEGQAFKENFHHRLIISILDQVLFGNLNRLIINIPPGYGKTMLAVQMFIARALTWFPDARFIHTSGSRDLVDLNSVNVKNIILSDSFQRLWPTALRSDQKGKKLWYTESGGGMYAIQAGGQITGFRAGWIKDGFSGAFIIDDPIKPDEVHSDVIRNRINNRFNNTMRSRLAVQSVPMILIMQRTHEMDLCGFLLTGGSGEQWHHLNIPATLDDREPYPEKYTHGIEIKYDPFEGTLWPLKHTVEDLDEIKRSDPYVYAAQYMQSPSPLGGGLFKEEWWQYYSAVPMDIAYKVIYGDTAMKTAEYNDYSVFQLWGFSPSKGAILLDQIRGKWEAPELELRCINFWHKHAYVHKVNPVAPNCIKIEDKSSGTGLIQAIQTKYTISVEPIPRDKDKTQRAMGVIPQIASGNVWLPEQAPWLSDYLEEFRRFTPLMTHSHDDQIDPTIDAIEDILINNNLSYMSAI